MSVLYVIVLGLFFNEETDDASFLNKKQSNELKGRFEGCNDIFL